MEVGGSAVLLSFQKLCIVMTITLMRSGIYTAKPS